MTKSAAGITEVKAFCDLSDTSQALLASGLRYVQCAKGAPILAKGQRVSGAYVVMSGRLRVFTLSPDGNEATLYAINPHETCVLALNCIFNDLLYPAWVEAGSAATVAVIPGAVFRALFEAEPAIRNMTVQAFSTIVFRLMTELEEIHSYKLERPSCQFPAASCVDRREGPHDPAGDRVAPGHDARGCRTGARSAGGATADPDESESDCD